MEPLVVFLSQAWMSFRSLYGWLRTDVFIWAKVIQPVSALALFTLVARTVLQVQDLSFYVIGNALTACWTSAFAGITAILVSERLRGTLPYVIITPTSRFVIFAGRSFFYFLDGIATVLIVLLFGSILFGLSFSEANLGAVVLSILAGVFSVSCAGLLLGTWALVYRDVNTIMNVATAMLLVFSGANFPVSSLPPYVSWISYVLPLTRSITATRRAFHGASLLELAPLLWVEFGIGLLFLALGYLQFIYVERQARIKASFDLY